jgi:hypothetical protein
MRKFFPAGFLALTIAAEVYAAQPCLKYEPEVVELKGKVKRVVFPGRPNYESVKAGDEPEPYYVLFLPKGVCVQGNPKDDINSETEKDIKSMQLMITDYKKYRPLLGKNVAVKGKLMHSHTGHHHTKVLLQVESMTATPNTPVEPSR